MMYPQQRPAQETSLMDDMGDAITGGWWRKSKSLFDTLISANAMLVLIFTRVRIGASLFNFGLLFWASGWLLLVTLIAQENWRHLLDNGMAEGHQFSGGWLWMHGTAFTWLYLIKWLVARLSIGSSSPFWFRDRVSIGESFIYPLIRWGLRPLGLIDQTTPRTFWKITHRRWMLIWEPLLLLIAAYYIKQAGYGAYGNLMTIATCCSAYITFQAVKNTDMETQALREARALQEHVKPHQPAKDKPRRAIGD